MIYVATMSFAVCDGTARDRYILKESFAWYNYARADLRNCSTASSLPGLASTRANNAYFTIDNSFNCLQQLNVHKVHLLMVQELGFAAWHGRDYYTSKKSLPDITILDSLIR